MLELAEAWPQGAGESAGLVAEQFALDQRGRESRAIDGDERPGCAAADVVQRACRHLLAGTGIADHQYVGIGCRDRPKLVAELDHHLGSAGQAGLEVVVLAGRCAQLAILQHQLAPVDGTPRHFD